ncbi:sterol O-acyltransferase 1 [Anolis carolinensis]|uniref:O-acyltransferase n=1 Tax=Anolis carolinensis TaxID=28377 RepID=R4GBR0_ANOCA|nr:PREDICTED: sterol O-acyltransferase 1 [Anolis carolinensis]|eukprot:XP_003225493.1 PREDICTED: sterol O-acyltransferase 1 [Anolis carolinensis]
MVGEDNISVRNRRSAYGTPEEKNDLPRRLEGDWSHSTSSNGRIDVDHTMRRMQLLTEAEKLKPAFMKGLDSHFTEFVNGLVAKSVLLESSPSAFPAARTEKDSFKTKGSRAPPEHGKVFVARRSLLDELFEVDHIQTIYHMFIALLILFILSTLVVDFIDEGRLVLEFDLLVYAFGKFSVVAPTWLYMFLFTLVVPYGLFLHWAKGYPGSNHKIIRSIIFGSLFLMFQMVCLGLVPVYIALSYELPPASCFIVILEQVRLVMKSHSYIRENVPRVISCPPQKSNSLQLPEVSQYLYFLFAPTLIYRDHYPRTPTRRWSYVATKFAQILGSLFYAYYIFVRLCIPTYRNFSRENFNLRGLVLCIFNSILPGVLILFLVFFAFLHCWLNAFAEMLCFADRMFYKDWWNSTSFSNYYRTWNVVVHDWLYYYAYRDFLWFFGEKSKAAAMLSVFTVSAAVHEYVLGVCFGYFYPVLFCLFMCFGMVFNFILHDRRKGPIWNVIMWTLLFLGQGVIICLYTQEWYAHRYCPLKNPTFLDYVKPRSWACQVKI